MNFSKKTQALTTAPKFLNKNKIELNHLIHVQLNKLGIDVNVYFNTIKNEEIEIEIANYFTEYAGEYLGVIDAYFALIQNRPIEAADRLPIKELDYYLRDDQGVSAFSGYSQEVYEVLSIGEKIKSKIFGEKKIGFQYNPKVDGDFFDLSSSEQHELIEEIFAYYVYPKNDFSHDIEVEDITDNEIVLKPSDKNLMKLIKEKLCIY